LSETENVYQQKLDLEQQMIAVERNQLYSRFHPLTCEGDKCQTHTVLKPLVEDGKVILQCPECEGKQEWIPDAIFMRYYNDNVRVRKVRCATDGCGREYAILPHQKSYRCVDCGNTKFVELS
jgi:hypothetical protein